MRSQDVPRFVCTTKVHRAVKTYQFTTPRRAIKSHTQNSTNYFFWDNVIARSLIALTTVYKFVIRPRYNPLDVSHVTPVNVSLHSK